MVYKSPFPDIDIPGVDILTYLFPTGSKPSDSPIWIDSKNPNTSLSPKQLLQWVKRLAIGLDRLGVQPGEVLMTYTPNHVFVPVAYLGAVGSRRVFTGANPIYTVPEMAHQITNSEARVILVHPSLVNKALEAAETAKFPKSRIFAFSDYPNPVIDGVQDWRSMIGTPEEAEQYSWKRMDEEESKRTVATVNYSSGTTGLPKGVMVSHYNLVANAEQHIFMKYIHVKEREPERWVGFLPLYHAYGQLWCNIMAIKLHVPVYVMKQFGYEEFLRVLQTYKITHLHVAPPILVMLSKRPETAKYDISSVKDVLCGAAPLSKELQNDVGKRFNMTIHQGWGMTEVTTGAVHVPFGFWDDSGSVGQLDPNSEIMLLDDDGKEVADGQPGEIYVRGPMVCLGYWRNERATQESLSPDGWLKTGDVAIVKEGWFWIVDRKKELIKVNALQVAPAELEAVLLEHEDIADAAVVGITLNEQEWPRAYVQLKEHAKGQLSQKIIQEWMKGKVAKHKQLVGGIAFVEEVPKLASGKIMRKVMKDWAKRDAAIIEGKAKAKL
ncbi:acetyl-CoA synthetase-like protein [Patellaria atrata CBS 101060]|uniref:Acetyl-CoA synthetase-like protein n=1 Tax=Patellaria atrata CBS 101060 TaxID=1346257 RepID=A0A9P4SE59_9PEZI|nr:acetyl-CoA synthetase-like protein [Patellaria atrata CBS 101060]